MPSEPSQAVKLALFALSNNECAYPDCHEPMALGRTVVGRICHIHARSPGGPRYNAELPEADLHGFENLVAFCSKHHDLVDKNESEYPPHLLRQFKRDHESRASSPSLKELMTALLRAVSEDQPEEWRDRPGAPVLKLGLGSNRTTWTFQIHPFQMAGDTITSIRITIRAAETTLFDNRLEMRTEGHWRAPDVHVSPEASPFRVDLKFWWQGAERVKSWIWESAEHFQSAQVQEVWA